MTGAIRQFATLVLAVLFAGCALHEIGTGCERAIVGHPSRDHAWLFPREWRMDDAPLADLPGRLGGAGHDASRIFKVPRFPGDVGRPGLRQTTRRDRRHDWPR